MSEAPIQNSNPSAANAMPVVAPGTVPAAATGNAVSSVPSGSAANGAVANGAAVNGTAQDALATIDRLPAQQQEALEMLISGESVAQTARAVGLSRSTLFRWLKSDPDFQAAYNQWQTDLEQSCRSRLLTLTDKAAGAVEQALEAGDARTALQLLKGMGLITPPPARPTEASEIRREADLAAKRKKIAETRQKHQLTMEASLAEVGV